MSLFRDLWNIKMASGNPTGVTSLLPGGANVQTAGSTAVPMVSTPTCSPFAAMVLDNTPTYLNASGVAQGNLVILPQALPNGLTAANQLGGGYWQQSSIYAQALPPLTYGVVNVSNSAQGSECQVYMSGPVQALCTASTTAIAYGSLLCADGLGNLTTFQPPSGAPTPTATAVGTTGSTAYNYALVAVSANGTYSAIGTASTGVSNGNATLSNTNYNQITWTPVADAASYLIVRTSSAGTPSTVGVIGQVAAADGVFNDTGLAIIPNTSATQFFQRTAAGGTPTVTNGGASGSTSWSYKISAILPNGVWSAEGSAGTNASGVATLTAANFNSLTWTLTSGATLYAIDRTAAGGTPSTTGIIGYIAVTPGTTPTIKFTDPGLPVIGTYAALSVTTPPPTPAPGTCLGIALGSLAASTTTPTLVNVWVGGF